MSDDRELITSPRDNEGKEKKPGKKRSQSPDDTDGRADGDKKGKCSCNTAFFLSVEGALKVVEFFTTLIAWIICALAYRHLNETIISRYGYFLFVGITCWIFTVIVISFHLFGLYNLWINNRLFRLFGWNVNLLAYSCIYTFFWAVAAILLAFQYKVWAGTAGAAFFGFVNLLLFFIDSIMYFRVCRKYRKEIRKIRRGGYQDANEV